MIDHVWSVLCSQSIIDNQSNNINLIGVIEQLTITGTPVPDGVVNMPLEVVSLWIRSEENRPTRGRGRFYHLHPTGNVETETIYHEFDIDLSTYQRLRTRIAIGALQVHSPGRHHFIVQLQTEVETGWREVARIPLQVLFTPLET